MAETIACTRTGQLDIWCCEKNN